MNIKVSIPVGDHAVHVTCVPADLTIESIKATQNAIAVIESLGVGVRVETCEGMLEAPKPAKDQYNSQYR